MTSRGDHMQFFIAETFTASLERLDGPLMGVAKSKAWDFLTHADRGGFRFHRVERGRDRDFWTARVNDDLRFVVHQRGDARVLCYVDRHDAAYRWAESRVLEVHPTTGAAQFVEVRERVEEVVRRVPVVEEPPLFERFADDYLLALGVPPAWLDPVRLATASTLHEFIGRLPEEAMERLIDLSEGRPVPRPAATSVGPYLHPDAQRRFRVVDGQEELRRALELPWDRWLVFLHPAQRAVVERRTQGPSRVSGGPGTGKSVVAIHRAVALARRPARVLLTTFSKGLAARLADGVARLAGDAPPEGLEVAHLHRVAHDLVWAGGTKPAPLTDPECLELVRRHMGPAVGAGLAPALICAEWSAVVDAGGLATWEEYRGATRAGRGTPLGLRQRESLWRVFERVRADLEVEGRQTYAGLCHGAALAGPTYDHVVVDEAQDFGPAELRLVRALVRPGPDDVLLCADAGQRIYRSRPSWRSMGLDVRGRSTVLRLNYRTTAEIEALADRLAPAVDAMDGDEAPRRTVSLLRGSQPELRGCADAEAELRGVVSWVETQIGAGFQPREIAVFARANRLVARLVGPLGERGIATRHLGDEDDARDAVALGTMHRAKGLEFRCVAVLGCDAATVPSPGAVRDAADDVDRTSVLEQERQLLYVALTRPRERLLVTWHGEPSPFLAAAAPERAAGAPALPL